MYPRAQAAISTAIAHAAEIDKATNPAIQNAEVSRAVRTQGALLPGEIQKSVQTQVALAKNSPEAFGAIVDPAARHKAEDQYEKDSSDAADKVAAANQLKAFVAAAQSGNKAAPGLIPIAAVRQLVNRVSSKELQSVSGSAGDLVDRVQGKISGLTAGQPIPAEVLKDISSISDLQRQAAKSTYAQKVDIANKTYGGRHSRLILSRNPWVKLR